MEYADSYDSLTWDTPGEPPENSLAVVSEKSVILVRHHFAVSGNVNEIYMEYLDDKITNNSM